MRLEFMIIYVTEELQKFLSLILFVHFSFFDEKINQEFLKNDMVDFERGGSWVDVWKNKVGLMVGFDFVPQVHWKLQIPLELLTNGSSKGPFD